MKSKKSPKRLILVKKTIAHLNDEQMIGARGGADISTKTVFESVVVCTNKANNEETGNCY
jgi:hypothetical protein